MTEKLRQTIKEEIALLPKEVEEAIGSIDWIRIAEEIGKDYEFDEAEMNNFELEILLVLTGTTDPEFFAINIENQVVLTKEKSKSVAENTFKKTQEVFTK